MPGWVVIAMTPTTPRATACGDGLVVTAAENLLRRTKPKLQLNQEVCFGSGFALGCSDHLAKDAFLHQHRTKQDRHRSGQRCDRAGQMFEGDFKFGALIIGTLLLAGVAFFIWIVASRSWCRNCKRFLMKDTGARGVEKEIQMIDQRMCIRCGHTKWCKGAIIGYGSD
jgi:hypothetical protein